MIGGISMNADMEFQIKRVFKTGFLSEFNKEVFIPDYYREFISEAVHNICDSCDLYYTDLSMLCQRSFKVAFGLRRHPAFGDWVTTPRAEKEQWLLENNIEYPVLFVLVSRVWPGYYFYYNMWFLNQEKRTVDIRILEDAPDSEWAEIQENAAQILDIPGMTHYTRQELFEEVPFVIDEEWPEPVDGEDDDWDSFDEIKPTLVPASLGQCLFEDN